MFFLIGGSFGDNMIPDSEISSAKTADSRTANYRIDKMHTFKLSPEDIVLDDGIQRVYIDEFKDVGDGKKWVKGTE